MSMATQLANPLAMVAPGVAIPVNPGVSVPPGWQFRWPAAGHGGGHSGGHSAGYSTGCGGTRWPFRWPLRWLLCWLMVVGAKRYYSIGYGGSRSIRAVQVAA